MDWFVRLWVQLLLTSVIAIGSVTHGANVTYDGRSLIIDGEHKILFSGSIHYPRSMPELWPSLIAKAKAGGIDVIQTYVFWNIHEPKQGQYDFSGRFDLVRFIKEVQAQGLYVCLRIGPFIQSEWNYGGFPVWLREVPGIVFRSDNEPFKFHMKRYAEMIVGMMKAENLYASQGGPIILSQIENEYGTIEKAFREEASPYVLWAANMAVGLQTGVPWVMCKQDDAPDPVINACNGLRCGETFAGPNSPNKPAIWTEDWTTVFEVFGEDPRQRSAEDIAFHVALFLANKKGSYVNYYMYHGGTNFGRTAADYVLTSYYDKAPLDEYGLFRQPKWGHLKELHAAVKLCIKPLLSGGHKNFSIGYLQEAHVFDGEANECAAFLVNYDPRMAVSVNFMNSLYHLPPKSISILPDCKTVALNTAKVNAQYGTRSMETKQKFDEAHRWEEYKEAIPSVDETSWKADMLLEQMGTTKDVSDYLWYSSRFYHNYSRSGSVLKVNSLGHNLHAFVNGAYLGSAHGSHGTKTFILEKAIPLKDGINDISLLSVLTGLPDGGGYLERRVLGLRRVRVRSDHRVTELTHNSWGYQIGMLGENKQIYTADGSNSIEWRRYRRSAHQRLTWYKTSFHAPEGDDPVAINLGSMGKGEAWVNGQSIGRYWVSFLTPKGKPSQTWYNVPRSFLKSKDNILVLFEEETGNPLGISIDTVSITKVCGLVSDLHPPPVISWRRFDEDENHHKGKPGRRPKVQLQCPSGKKISRILFSSFGTPSGDCQSHATGSCHFPNSTAIVEKVCVGKNRCTIPVWNRYFGGDPCPGVSKSLLVDAQCG